jgi:transcriptional regulator with XRE-family HTH domain
MLFARCVRRLREQLGLSVKRAAELSGMETSDWYALEAGWVPSQDSGLVDAIAGTLECGHIQTSFIAEISRYNQEVLFNTLPLRAS